LGIGERRTRPADEEEAVMSLSSTLDRFKKAALCAHGERVYAEARSRHSALAPFETVGAVLAASGRGSAASIAERDAISRPW